MSHYREKDYYEQLAKYLLEELLPEEYAALEISDKPDLRMNGNHGIEVTRAIYESEAQADRVFQHIQQKCKDQIDSRYLQTLNKCGYKEYEANEVILGYGSVEGIWATDELLKQVFLKKVKKAEGYRVAINDLFIFSRDSGWFEEGLIRDFFRWVNDYDDNPFLKIFVFEAPYLYIWTTCEGNLAIKEINENAYQQCRNSAWKSACKC